MSFGRNEPTKGLYDRANAEELGIEFVRRPTGGRAVLHQNEITYAVVLPVRALGGPKASYMAINRGLAEGLSAIGAVVAVTDDGEPLPPDSGACFGTPIRGEIVVGEKKLVGSAQLRVGDALLQHGSIIIDGDQSLIHKLTGQVGDLVPAATLHSVLGVVQHDQVTEAVIAGLKDVLGGHWHAGEYSLVEEEEAGRLEQERYRDCAWTWRR